jgi:E3 SUMO-protein ligase PIAS1
MMGGAALAPSLPPPAPPVPAQQQQQQQHAKEQLQKAVAMNAVRLQAIGDRIKGHFRGGPEALPSDHLNHLVYAFARSARIPPPPTGIVPRFAAPAPPNS